MDEFDYSDDEVNAASASFAHELLGYHHNALLDDEDDEDEQFQDAMDLDEIQSDNEEIIQPPTRHPILSSPLATPTPASMKRAETIESVSSLTKESSSQAKKRKSPLTKAKKEPTSEKEIVQNGILKALREPITFKLKDATPKPWTVQRHSNEKEKTEINTAAATSVKQKLESLLEENHSFGAEYCRSQRHYSMDQDADWLPLMPLFHCLESCDLSVPELLREQAQKHTKPSLRKRLLEYRVRSLGQETVPDKRFAYGVHALEHLRDVHLSFHLRIYHDVIVFDHPELQLRLDSVHVTDFLADLEAGRIPADLMDVFHEAPSVCTYYDGCLVIGVTDYRWDEIHPSTSRLLLRPSTASLIADMELLACGQWSTDFMLKFESQLLQSIEPVVQTSPSINIMRFMNWTHWQSQKNLRNYRLQRTEMEQLDWELEQQQQPHHQNALILPKYARESMKSIPFMPTFRLLQVVHERRKLCSALDQEPLPGIETKQQPSQPKPSPSMALLVPPGRRLIRTLRFEMDGPGHVPIPHPETNQPQSLQHWFILVNIYHCSALQSFEAIQRIGQSLDTSRGGETLRFTLGYDTRSVDAYVETLKTRYLILQTGVKCTCDVTTSMPNTSAPSLQAPRVMPPSPQSTIFVNVHLTLLVSASSRSGSQSQLPSRSNQQQRKNNNNGNTTSATNLSTPQLRTGVHPLSPSHSSSPPRSTPLVNPGVTTSNNSASALQSLSALPANVRDTLAGAVQNNPAFMRMVASATNPQRTILAQQVLTLHQQLVQQNNHLAVAGRPVTTTLADAANALLTQLQMRQMQLQQQQQQSQQNPGLQLMNAAQLRAAAATSQLRQQQKPSPSPSTPQG